MRNLRLARDFERHCRIAAAFIRMAMVCIMFGRWPQSPHRAAEVPEWAFLPCPIGQRNPQRDSRPWHHSNHADPTSALVTCLSLLAVAISNFNSKSAIVASFNFIREGVATWGALIGEAAVIALPPLVLTLVIQRHLVGGLSAGAVKG